jgi:cytochrome b561
MGRVSDNWNWASAAQRLGMLLACIALLGLLNLFPCSDHCREAQPRLPMATFFCDLPGAHGATPDAAQPHHHHLPSQPLVTSVVLLLFGAFALHEWLGRSPTLRLLTTLGTPPTPPPRAR